MLDKQKARQRLSQFFGTVHVEGFLSKFEETHTWREEDLFPEFISYCNKYETISRSNEKKTIS